jgi:hypothetical protein
MKNQMRREAGFRHWRGWWPSGQPCVERPDQRAGIPVGGLTSLVSFAISLAALK